MALLSGASDTCSYALPRWKGSLGASSGRGLPGAASPKQLPCWFAAAAAETYEQNGAKQPAKARCLGLARAVISDKQADDED